MPGRVLRGVFSAMLLTSALLSAVPATAAVRVYARIGPPARVVEVRPAAPGPRYVWVEGFHRWDGNGFAWVPGRWAVPPKGRAAWVPGHWVHASRGWYFVDGHWRR